MIYIDTNVIISYIDEADPNHGKALKLVEGLSGDRVVSRLTLAELVSVYSRAGLEDPLPLAMYSLKRIKAKIVEVDFNEILRIAIVKAPILKLKTLDLLHIITCKVAGCGEFATMDSSIIGKSEVIGGELGVRVMGY
ncbi:MAG: type II toxin-antitoxin system VapC family toxin [archaeon YNP-WB-062]|nr:type II toxin-antitoxin system VapC family toxin [Candidatus Culexarchaeum yellowstonense]